MNAKRAVATTYVRLAKLFGVNTVTHDVLGTACRFGYDTVTEFVQARNAITGGETTEGVPLALLDRSRCDVVVDVGAHYGIHSVVMGVLNRSARLYAFEPLADLHSRLTRNLELNALLSSATVRGDVVAGTSGDTTPFAVDSSPGSERHGPVDDLGLNVVTNPTVALSDVFTDGGIDDPFVKIDAGGNEGDIVHDLMAQDVMSSLAGIVELHPDKLTEYDPDGVLALLRDGGSRIERVCESALDYGHFREIYYFVR